jgi:hypothetical protein
MPKKLNQKKKATIHSDLKDFDIHINEFGEIVTNYSIETLNEFLDKKLGKDRRDLKEYEPKTKR